MAAKKKGSTSPSSRGNKSAPQHRGTESGGTLSKGLARSPKKGGVPIQPPTR